MSQLGHKRFRLALILSGFTPKADIDIDLNGFPRGTRTETAFGGMFTQVALNRGRSMPNAIENS